MVVPATRLVQQAARVWGQLSEGSAAGTVLQLPCSQPRNVQGFNDDLVACLRVRMALLSFSTQPIRLGVQE